MNKPNPTGVQISQVGKPLYNSAQRFIVNVITAFLKATLTDRQDGQMFESSSNECNRIG